MSFLDDISDMTGLRKSDIISVCRSEHYSPYFSIDNTELLKYIPPYGITNRTSMIKTLDNMFPCGIRTRILDSCYEFAVSDFNSLIYEKKLYRMSFGKTPEGVIFAYPFYNVIDISEAWESVLNLPKNNSNILIFSKKDVISQALVESAVKMSEDDILTNIIQTCLESYVNS